MPSFSKFLLIAAYLASYNQPKTDKRFFLKNAGKIKKRARVIKGPDIKQKMVGPLTFSIDRLIARVKNAYAGLAFLPLCLRESLSYDGLFNAGICYF